MDSWKSLERHPLSAHYPDITGPAWDRYLAGFREFGIVGGRQIMLHEGKVLDCWQLYRACVAENIRPEFTSLPQGMTAEKYVEIANDNRRHESAGTIEQRVAQRRQRVADARRNGHSLRAIGEELGISKSQVERDLQGVPRGTPEPGTPKILGKDGKQYPRGPRQRAIDDHVGGKKGEPEPVAAAAKIPKKKPGKPVFDDQQIKDALGKLVRLFNDRANAFGHQHNTSYQTVRERAEALLAAWKEWRKT
jgi:hypothetical protein